MPPKSPDPDLLVVNTIPTLVWPNRGLVVLSNGHASMKPLGAAAPFDEPQPKFGFTLDRMVKAAAVQLGRQPAVPAR
jgi:hypothetical protein